MKNPTLQNLIQELCPDGVEFRKLGDLLNISTGKLNANAIVKDGEYPFFTCAEKPFLIDSYAFDTEAILISGNGSQVGHINYFKGKFNAYQRTYILSHFNDTVVVKFLLHILKGYLKEYILKNVKEGSVPYITLPMLQKFKIPLPPIAIQEEIVRILDTFTELESELEGRKKQYEYYRDDLLTFGDEVEWKTLGEVILKTENIKWKYNKNIEYKYIDLSSVNRENNKIIQTQIINSDNAPSRAQQIVCQDDVLFGTTRPTLKRFAIISPEYDKQICSTGFMILRANTKFILPKYLFFYTYS